MTPSSTTGEIKSPTQNGITSQQHFYSYIKMSSNYPTKCLILHTTLICYLNVYIHLAKVML